MYASKTEEDLRDQMIRVIFGSELKRQCAFALIAMDDVMACLKGMDSLSISIHSMPPPHRAPMREILLNIWKIA